MNTVSVLIATKDRADDLRECLTSVLSQDPPPSEVIIVDQSRRPQHEAVTTLFSGSRVRLRYDYAPALPGLTHARNRALDQATSSVVLFLDDDVVLNPGYLRAMLSVFDDDPAERIGGAIWESDVERGQQTRVADGELRKLAIYAGDRAITSADVEALVSDTRPASLFAITAEAVLDKLKRLDVQAAAAGEAGAR